MAHPGGRPPKFTSPEHMEALYDEYENSLAPDEIPDVEGFCVYVDAWRDLFSEYGTKPEFSDTVKRIKNRIYAKKKQLAMQNKMNATIFIFDAKNNAGYTDKTEQDITSGGEKIAPVLVRFVGDDNK